MNEIPFKLTVTNLTKAEKDDLLSAIELTSVRIQSESRLSKKAILLPQ